MPETADIREIFEINKLFSPVICPVCGASICVRGEQIDGAINHVLTHGWRLLHVGAEFGQDEEGKSISHTVAFLGKAAS